ncbi:MAG: hypothetical protein ABSD09_15940 [Xanthobacteraceae bacterium]
MAERPDRAPACNGIGADMCESCVQIDDRIEECRRALGKITDLSVIERTNKAITELYADRVRLHKNPEW